MRAIACISVMLAHYRPGASIPSNTVVSHAIRALDAFSLANLGVVFFHTLSAFILTYLAIREWETRGSFGVKHFYLRRVFRIWPLYVVLVTFDLVTASPYGPLWPGIRVPAPYWAWISEHLWMYVLFVSNWSQALRGVGGHIDLQPPLGVLWSIAVEEQFYLVYPLLLLMVLNTPRWRWLTFMVMVPLGLIWRSIFALLPVDPAVSNAVVNTYYSTFAYLDVFLAGALAGWLATRHPAHATVRILRHRIVGAGILAGFVGLALSWQSGWLWYGSAIFIYGAAGIVFAVGLLWIVTNPTALLVRGLRSRPMRVLGTLAFGMYLWHPTFIPLVEIYVGPQQIADEAKALLALVVFMGGTATVAALTYVLVERPFLILKARYFSPSPRAIPALMTSERSPAPSRSSVLDAS